MILLLAVAAAKGWSLSQLDISNAFLNGDLEEEIYMTLPPGYSARQGESFPPNDVCKLKKSLYGLKQASQKWFLKFSATLLQLGFTTSSGDHTLFLKNSGDVYMVVLVYVDDILIASSCDKQLSYLKLSYKHLLNSETWELPVTFSPLDGFIFSCFVLFSSFFLPSSMFLGSSDSVVNPCAL